MAFVKCVVKKSNVSNIGLGLFANQKIKANDLICEFTGKLTKPNSGKMISNRSNIYFNDGYVLQCPENDPASYANDALNFSRVPRFLHESFESAEPFYKKHSGASVNAKILTDHDAHLAALEATRDIESGEEIFCHYGFTYWFIQELQGQLFMINPRRMSEGFPSCVYEYPSFKAYIKEFYPDCTSTKLVKRADDYDVVLTFPGNSHVTIKIDDYSKTVQTKPVQL